MLRLLLRAGGVAGAQVDLCERGDRVAGLHVAGGVEEHRHGLLEVLDRLVVLAEEKRDARRDR